MASRVLDILLRAIIERIQLDVFVPHTPLFTTICMKRTWIKMVNVIPDRPELAAREKWPVPISCLIVSSPYQPTKETSI
jgi:hypothetical protein